MYTDEAAGRVPVAQAELEFVHFVVRVVRFGDSLPLPHAIRERLAFFAVEDDEPEMSTSPIYAEPADRGVDDPEYAFGGKRSTSVGCGCNKTNGWALASGKEVDDAFRTSNMATLRSGMLARLNRGKA